MCVCVCVWVCAFVLEIPYSGKLSNGANFRIFHMRSPHEKIGTSKILSVRKFYNVKFLTGLILIAYKILYSLAETRLHKGRNS